MKTGIGLIAQEREEQINKHGRTASHDLENNEHGDLGDAASIMSMFEFGCNEPEEMAENFPHDWDREMCRKMINKPYRERLIIAGAMIAAELDRMQLDPDHIE